jgi:hypothetical protein
VHQVGSSFGTAGPGSVRSFRAHLPADVELRGHEPQIAPGAAPIRREATSLILYWMHPYAALSSSCFLIVKHDTGGKQTTGPAETLPRGASTVCACYWHARSSFAYPCGLRRVLTKRTERKHCEFLNIDMKTLCALALAAAVADALLAAPDEALGFRSARLRGSAGSQSRTLLLPPPALKTNQTYWKQEGVPGPGGAAGVNGSCTEAFLEACATRSTIQTCAPSEKIALANANIEYGDDDPFTVWYSGTGSSCEWIYQPCL